MRCWDCHWQDPKDYGTKYDFGLYEAHPAMMAAFHKHRSRTPGRGYIASFLGPTRDDLLPNPTTIIDQTKWTAEARALGGIGATGNLHFQRGTIAACYEIERASPGDEVILFGFDNTLAGRTLTINAGYSEQYRAEPSTFTFRGYIENAVRYGNHDFSIERPYLEMLAARCGVRLSFAQEKWPLRTALVLGDAKCVYADAERALATFNPNAICATTNIGRDWPGHVDYWCTLHPFKAPDWVGIEDALQARIAAGRNRPEIWAHKKLTPSVDFALDHDGGSTGMLCVNALRSRDFDRIVLAGVPMTSDGGHYYDDKPWVHSNHYTAAWAQRRDELAPFVRSMSGYTKQLFGSPEPEWFASSAASQAA